MDNNQTFASLEKMLLLQFPAFVKQHLRLVSMLFALLTFMGVAAQTDGTADVTIDGIKYHVSQITSYPNEKWEAQVDGHEPGIVTADIPNTVSAEVTYYAGMDSQGKPIYKTCVVTAPVTSVWDEAFEDCKTLTNVIIGDSVTYIGTYAFAHCTALESLTIGLSVSDINWCAFSGCAPKELTHLAKSCSNLTDMTFANIEKVTIGTEVEDFSFWSYENDCCPKELIWNARHCVDNGDMYVTRIESVTIGDEVEYLPNGFLRGGAKISAIAIPSSVNEIGHGAFTACTSLSRVDISDLSAWCKIYFHGVDCEPEDWNESYDWDPWDYWDYEYDGSPGIYTSNPCCYGAELYLNGKKVTNLAIPYNITKINQGSFSGCGSLTSVTIGDHVTSVGARSFDHCGNLTGAYIGIGVTNIGDYAFAETPVSSVYIGTAMTNIGKGAFLFSGSRDALGKRFVRISDRAKWCQITFEDIDANPLYVRAYDLEDGYYAFNYSSSLKLQKSGKDVTTLKDLDNVQHINKYAFAMCGSLTTIDSQNPFISIGDSAFYHCINLATVDVPGTVTSIGDYAFYDCRGLTGLTLPNSITHIGRNAFDLIHYYGSINDNPHGLITLAIPEAITSISDCAFAGWTRLNKITIPKNVTYIGDHAFYGHGYSADLDVTCYAKNPPQIFNYWSFWGYLVGSNEYDRYTLRVPKNSVGLYKTANYWKDFGTILAIEEEGPDNPADLNGDGEVNIADVNALIDIILRGSGGNEGAGDVNGDGEVNIADVNALINIILTSHF